MSISDCQCQYLTVNFSKRQATYELSENINGKPSWKSETLAIWYRPKFKTWLIGKVSNIGTSIAGIASVDKTEYDCPQQVPKDKWKYLDGSAWQAASSNDVSFQCTTGKKQQNRKIFDS